MPLPRGLESIAGAQQLHDWFGYWPDFHDAVVLKLHIDLSAPSWLVIHTWDMTNRVDARGYYELAKHVVVEFVLEGVHMVSLEDLWDHSILLDVVIAKTETGFRISLSAAYGLCGSIEAKDVSLRITPGPPPIEAPESA